MPDRMKLVPVGGMETVVLSLGSPFPGSTEELALGTQLIQSKCSARGGLPADARRKKAIINWFLSGKGIENR